VPPLILLCPLHELRRCPCHGPDASGGRRCDARAPYRIGIEFRVPSDDACALGIKRGRDFGDLPAVARGDRLHTPLVRAVVVLADKHAHLLSLNVTESGVALKAIEFAQAALLRGVDEDRLWSRRADDTRRR